MDLFIKVVRYMEDLLILGIMVRWEQDLRIMLRMLGERDLFKKMIIVIGTKELVKTMVDNNRKMLRYSLLRPLLEIEMNRKDTEETDDEKTQSD